MAKNEQMLRLKFIEELLRKRKDKGASYQEIEAYLTDKFEDKDIGDKLNFTERTFLRDKQSIRDVFGIDISYSRKNNVYFIDEEELEISNQSIYDNLLLVEAYRETKDKKDILLFETRKSKGLNYLHGLIHAIINRNVIRFNYEKFWDDAVKERVVEPYALKEFRHRWYLLAKEHKKDGAVFLKTFGLDRISDLDISSSTFKRETVDVNQLFVNAFGIIYAENDKPETIHLAFDKTQIKYIKALPIHHSQKIVSETESETIVELKLIPTYDFEREIISYGQNVKVIKPQHFKDKIRAEIQTMLENYS